MEKNDGVYPKSYVKKQIGKHISITPDMVSNMITSKLSDPIIGEQIEEANRVYENAEKVLSDLYGKNKGVIGFGNKPNDSVGIEIASSHQKKSR